MSTVCAICIQPITEGYRTPDARYLCESCKDTPRGKELLKPKGKSGRTIMGVGRGS